MATLPTRRKKTWLPWTPAQQKNLSGAPSPNLHEDPWEQSRGDILFQGNLDKFFVRPARQRLWAPVTKISLFQPNPSDHEALKNIANIGEHKAHVQPCPAIPPAYSYTLECRNLLDQP